MFCVIFIACAAVAGKLSVASPPNSFNRDDCKDDAAALCYERLLHHATQIHPLYGRNRAELEDTCKNIKDSTDCLKQYISRCSEKTDDAKGRDLIVRSEYLVRNRLYLSQFYFLCDLESNTSRRYLENAECLHSLASSYASCRNTFQKSASYLSTKPWSPTGQCCLYEWYDRCLQVATKEPCSRVATFFVSMANTGLMRPILESCGGVDSHCESPPLPPEGDNENAVCSVPPISNGRALAEFFFWNHTHWKQVSEGHSIRDGQDFRVECSDGFAVKDTGLQRRDIQCSRGHFDGKLECAVQCRVPHTNNGIIRRPVKSGDSTRHFKELSGGEFIEEGEELSLLCSEGHTFGGSEYRQMDIFCRQGRLSLEPLCKPVPSCGDPGLVSNGRSVVSRVTFPHSVKLECFEGFEISGTSTRFCQLDGEWSGKPPSCERVKSCVLETNSQIMAEPVKEHYFLGDQVTFSCNAGWKLSNDVQRVMCLGESWMPYPLPHCVEDIEENDS